MMQFQQPPQDGQQQPLQPPHGGKPPHEDGKGQGGDVIERLKKIIESFSEEEKKHLEAFVNGEYENVFHVANIMMKLPDEMKEEILSGKTE